MQTSTRRLRPVAVRRRRPRRRRRGAPSAWRRDLVPAGDRTCSAPARRPEERRVLLLTATPVNTGMTDLVNLLRVLTKNQRSVWAPEIADFERHLKRVERGEADPFPCSIVPSSAAAAATSSAPRQRPGRPASADRGGSASRAPPRARRPRLRRAGRTCSRPSPGRFARLALAPYDLERFRMTGCRRRCPLTSTTAPVRRSMARTVTSPSGPVRSQRSCAAGLLVRFQSSVAAIRRSLRRVDAVMARFGAALDLDPPRLLDLQGERRGAPPAPRDEAAGRRP